MIMANILQQVVNFPVEQPNLVKKGDFKKRLYLLLIESQSELLNTHMNGELF